MIELAATRAVACGNDLGEGIVWCARRQALYWTDIEAARLWRHCPATGATDTWRLPERLASFALCEDDDWLLLGLASRLAWLQLSSGRVEAICAVEPDLPTRINDGACDREGRFVFGTKHEPEPGVPAQPVGSFYRLDPDLSLHRLDLDRVAIANGIAFSADGRSMYFCDSATRIVYRCEYTAAGETRGVRAWIDLRDAAGEPDGAAADADGGLWLALWGAGRVVRYDRNGIADASVRIPARLASRPALGGPDLHTLYVTSARHGLTAAELHAEGEAGNVFVAATTRTGIPEPRFAGAPPIPSRQSHTHAQPPSWRTA
ncbi:MAG: SMP-30/gluconolactonase/LRE family protein [Rhodanobacteraceae bacterium]|nr:MAG: SMP-30/gluconolactonase/LRE family protein [Rhodanobacteraceae bacterium]